MLDRWCVAGQFPPLLLPIASRMPARAGWPAAEVAECPYIWNQWNDCVAQRTTRPPTDTPSDAAGSAAPAPPAASAKVARGTRRSCPAPKSRRAGIIAQAGLATLAAIVPILKPLAAMEAMEEKNRACRAAIAATRWATGHGHRSAGCGTRCIPYNPRRRPGRHGKTRAVGVDFGLDRL